MKKWKSWDEWVDPLYYPLFTAIPIGGWLLFKQPPYSSVEITLFTLAILFLIFSGMVETSQDEGKHRLIGLIYLLSALLLAIIGVVYVYNFI